MQTTPNRLIRSHQFWKHLCLIFPGRNSTCLSSPKHELHTCPIPKLTTAPGSLLGTRAACCNQQHSGFFPFPLTLSHWDCLLTANIPYAKAFEYPPIDSKRINLQFDPVELEISQVTHQQATEITNLTLTPQKVLAACYCRFKSAPSSYSTTFINWTCCNQACF